MQNDRDIVPNLSPQEANLLAAGEIKDAKCENEVPGKSGIPNIPANLLVQPRVPYCSL